MAIIYRLILYMKLKNDATSDSDLVDIIKNMGITTYTGAFMKDQLPKTLKVNNHIIINLDSSTTGINGTHWVCLSNMRMDGKLTYFDSFGLPPPDEIVSLSRRMRKKLLYNTTQYQEITSNFCGFWCIYMIHRRFLGDSFYDALYSINNNQSNFIPNYFAKY